MNDCGYRSASEMVVNLRHPKRDDPVPPGDVRHLDRGTASSATTSVFSDPSVNVCASRRQCEFDDVPIDTRRSRTAQRPECYSLATPVARSFDEHPDRRDARAGSAVGDRPRSTMWLCAPSVAVMLIDAPPSPSNAKHEYRLVVDAPGRQLHRRRHLRPARSIGLTPVSYRQRVRSRQRARRLERDLVDDANASSRRDRYPRAPRRSTSATTLGLGIVSLRRVVERLERTDRRVIAADASDERA